MKVLILSASPKGENSVTLNTLRYVEKISGFSVKDEFKEILIGNGVFTDEVKNEIGNHDLIIFCSSLFHFNVHQQFMVFMDQMKEQIGDGLKDKCVTYFTTSSQQLDTQAHYYVERRTTDLGAKFIKGLSIRDHGLLLKHGEEEIANWYHYVRSYVINENEKFKSDACKIVLVDCTEGTNAKIAESIEKTKTYFANAGASRINLVNLREYKLAQCQACTMCYGTRECVMQDDYKKVAEMVYGDNDVIVYFDELQDGLFGKLHKLFMERQVQYGLVPLHLEYIQLCMSDNSKAVGDDFFHFELHEKAACAMAGLYDAGICDISKENEIEKYYQDVIRAYNYERYPQTNYYGQGMCEIFRNVGWVIQKSAPYTYNYYKEAGEYKLQAINLNMTRFSNYKEAMEAQKNRLTPQKMVLAGVQEDPAMKTTRRTNGAWTKITSKELVKVNENEGFFAKIFGKLKNLFKK